MLGKGAVACLISILAAVHAVGAQDVTAVVDRDLRVFTMSAALNVAGFDVELAPQYHPVRALIRERLAGIDPDLVRRLREFYRDHRGTASDEDQLAAYLSLALSVTEPPELAPLYSDALTPLDAREVAGFLPLASELYSEGNLVQLWRQLASEYDAGLDRLVPSIREVVVQSEAYLRVPSGNGSGRREVILLELSLPVNSVNIRNYPDNLYIVLGAGSVASDVIRHGYLHLQLDLMLAGQREHLGPMVALLPLVRGVEGVNPAYTEDAETLIGESLIRAVELRMDQVDDAPGLVDQAYREGLLLAPYFYEQLGLYEAGDLGIRQYFPEMAAGLDIVLEQARFDDRFFSIPPATAEVARANVPAVIESAPERGLLEDAEVAFNAGDDETALDLFERVLTDFDQDNGPALYGMALIASRNQDPVLARQYFSRTIDSPSAEVSMVTWSHIYLGRIDDIACDRNAALAHYRRALELGDDSRGARAAAVAGVETPFGEGC